jgi:hypothetical protein
MKKLILSATLIMVAWIGMDAQAYKWWAGGRTNFWTNDNVTSFGIAPEVGYHLSPKLTLAASLGFQAENRKCFCNKKKTNGFLLNPYMRYTAFKSGIVLGFVDGGFELGLGDIDGFQIGLKPGIAVLLTDRFTAATQFGFIGYNDGKGIAGRSKGVGFDLSGYCTTIAFFYSF